MTNRHWSRDSLAEVRQTPATERQRLARLGAARSHLADLRSAVPKWPALVESWRRDVERLETMR